MKYLENSTLSNLSMQLDENALDCALETRLECYSCKMVTSEKRTFNNFLHEHARDGDANSYQTLSPPAMDDAFVPADFVTVGSAPKTSDESSDSPGLETADFISNKTLFYLIETLNASFPDYAFFSASGRDFFKAPSIAHFMQSVDTKLLVSVANYNSLKMYLWAAVDAAIDLKNSIAYSYLPGSNGDPFTEPGCIWSFNNIIYNRRLNRILFFSCRAMAPQSVELDESDFACQWDLDA
uniref:Repressor of RNA polymerase III transcription MAF1 n=1 Tax=Trichuris muris TaxID=70415 RepID=A0A5S6Q9I0_TRIMR